MPPKKEKIGKKSIEKKVESSVLWGKFMKSVIEVVGIVRRKHKKQDLPGGFFENRNFFKHIGFFKDLKDSCPGVEVIEDEKNKKVRLQGRNDEFYGACNKCDNVLNKLHKKIHVLKDAQMWHIISKNGDYVKKMMAVQHIRAKVCFYLFVLIKIDIVSNISPSN
ncbi:Hypothetical predicted protein [Paramuricea clavata]|uniref:Uncharacterized protein n=1 Tax=Paramuricea clavata TaxID=317549 RepID=A0A6S7KZ10_PARCT|nr:Hypothetical predicted protein [Paramuricea clavata]